MCFCFKKIWKPFYKTIFQKQKWEVKVQEKTI